MEVPDGYTPRRRERSATRFSQSFVLGNKVDPEKTTAEMKDGLLTISIAEVRRPTEENHRRQGELNERKKAERS